MRSALVLVVCAACGDNAAQVLPEVTDAPAWVDPRIGTGGLGFAFGSCFVGAVAPHGFAKPGPDTNGLFGVVAFQHYSGYFAEDDRIRGFSSVHLHGTGATDYGILSVMPTLAFDAAKTSVVDYEAHFAKSDERVTAGYYGVTLASGIDVELTATQRVAVERFTMPAAGTLVIDLAKTLDGGKVDAATITVDDATGVIEGQLHHLGGMSAGFGGYTLYFSARAAAPFASHQQWTAPGAGAALALPTGKTTIAFGLSLVSLEGARANLAAEVPVVDFDAAHDRTTAAWQDQLGVVKLTGGTEVQRRIFYTSLYHAFLMPSVIDDVDGSYQLAGQPVQLATGWHQMSDLSLWDTYRTVAPLYAWLAPASAHDQARSLIGFGDGLGAYPKWPLATGETGTMLGASAEVVIADAVMRGVPDAGGDAAWARLRAAAMDTTTPAGGRGGRNDVDSYMQYGYVPNTQGRSVSTTTEYAVDDFALANLAGALGHTADHDALLARSHGWTALYDPNVGFLRGKNPDGSFPASGFDPFMWLDEYAEADAWQSLWMAGSHDPDGLAQMFGGTDAAVAKLTEFFTKSKTDWETSDPSAANFPRKWYWAGNEPDIAAPFLFTELGHPELTADWAGWIEDTIYTDQPDGVPGNDDGGTLGSWFVLSAAGLYPVPGSDQWIVGSPLFPKLELKTPRGTFTIEAQGVSVENLYVQSAKLNGAPLLRAELTQSDLVDGGKLVLVMGAKPSEWGH